MELKFEPVTDEAIKYIAENMRDAEVEEIIAAGSRSPLEALQNSMDISQFHTLITADGVPLVILGLVVTSGLTKLGCPWMLGTQEAGKHKREFLTRSKPVIDEMLDICPRLVNYVHVKNKLSIRWLRWLGFEFDDPILFISGEWFHRFYMER